jgi:hypothetical protein
VFVIIPTAVLPEDMNEVQKRIAYVLYVKLRPKYLVKNLSLNKSLETETDKAVHVITLTGNFRC